MSSGFGLGADIDSAWPEEVKLKTGRRITAVRLPQSLCFIKYTLKTAGYRVEALPWLISPEFGALKSANKMLKVSIGGF
jgi:hypothetical protein